MNIMLISFTTRARVHTATLAPLTAVHGLRPSRMQLCPLCNTTRRTLLHVHRTVLHMQSCPPGRCYNLLILTYFNSKIDELFLQCILYIRIQFCFFCIERQPPRIIPPPEGTTFVEGTSPTLNCTSIYDVNITWSMGGKPFGEVVLLDSLADGGGTVSVVTFNALRSQHQRVLKCVIPSAVEGANVPPPATEIVLSIVCTYIAFPPPLT